MTKEQFLSLPDGILIAERREWYKHIFSKKPNREYFFDENGDLYCGGFRQKLEDWEIPTERDLEMYEKNQKKEISRQKKILQEQLHRTARWKEMHENKEVAK